MPWNKKRNNTSSGGGRGKKKHAPSKYLENEGAWGKPWSNSVGTRYTPRFWVNPTVGQTSFMRGRNTWTTEEAQACLEVVKNAFSDATNQPRFPDGKASESIGYRGQMITEITQRGSETMDILFYCGVNTPLTITGGNLTSVSDLQNTRVADKGGFSLMTLQNHVRGIFTRANDHGDNIAGVQSWNIEQPNSVAIAKWRPVSYGLMLSLVNNAEENDGWWEACRVTVAQDKSMYGMSIYEAFAQDTADPPAPAPNQNASPNPAAAVPRDDPTRPLEFVHKHPTMSSSMMLQNQSYSTGKLRNIHHVVFQLNPELRTHEFNDLPKRTNVKGAKVGYDTFRQNPNNNPAWTEGQRVDSDYTATADMGDDARNGFVDLGTEPNGKDRIEDEGYGSFLDTSFDAIYIRIHGNPGSEINGAAVRGPSRLTAHVVMNQELVYDETSENAKFHQAGSPNHPGISRLVHNSKTDNAASVVK